MVRQTSTTVGETTRRRDGTVIRHNHWTLRIGRRGWQQLNGSGEPRCKRIARDSHLVRDRRRIIGLPMGSSSEQFGDLRLPPGAGPVSGCSGDSRRMLAGAS
jgi:hypothetical protein